MDAPLRVPAEGGEYVLTRRPDPRKLWNPALYDFTPADQFDIRGTYVTEHTRKEGVGAPMVAVGREMNKEAETDFSTAAHLLRRHRDHPFRGPARRRRLSKIRSRPRA